MYFHSTFLMTFVHFIKSVWNYQLDPLYFNTIDLLHWRHVSITTTPCWGSRLVMLRARVVLAERIGAQPLSQCAGPGQPGGMACRGWPAGCMLGDGACGSVSFDPQHAGAPFCDVICIWSILQKNWKYETKCWFFFCIFYYSSNVNEHKTALRGFVQTLEIFLSYTRYTISKNFVHFSIILSASLWLQHVQ